MFYICGMGFSATRPGESSKGGEAGKIFLIVSPITMDFFLSSKSGELHFGERLAGAVYFLHQSSLNMKIAIGSDHAGYTYKEAIKTMLGKMGHEVLDCGTRSAEAVDYPLFIRPAAEAVAAGECERGIVLGGSGNGEAMCANKVRGIRCALSWNPETARLARAHNDANMISLGERMIDLETALEIVRVWLRTPFEGGRHERRIKLLENQETVP